MFKFQLKYVFIPMLIIPKNAPATNSSVTVTLCDESTNSCVTSQRTAAWPPIKVGSVIILNNVRATQLLIYLYQSFDLSFFQNKTKIIFKLEKDDENPLSISYPNLGKKMLLYQKKKQRKFAYSWLSLLHIILFYYSTSKK